MYSIELVGKTIQSVHYLQGEEIGFVFEDNTYTILEGKAGYDSDISVEFVHKSYVEDYDLLQMGVITQEEYQDKMNAVRERELFEKKDREMRQLIELQRKYGYSVDKQERVK